jgi:hypothetical protein
MLQGVEKDMYAVSLMGAEGVKKGHLVFSTPGENFCKWLYGKKLAAKK